MVQLSLVVNMLCGTAAAWVTLLRGTPIPSAKCFTKQDLMELSLGSAAVRSAVAAYSHAHIVQRGALLLFHKWTFIFGIIFKYSYVIKCFCTEAEDVQ